MNSRDLLDEAHACESRLIGHMESLRKLGVIDGMARLGMTQPACGLARIRTDRSGFWEPDENGVQALVIPVCVPFCFEQFGCDLETIEVIDLIAFSSRQPAQWYWRTGDAWALGEEFVIDADEPLRLVATPLQWLRLGGKAVCILDWRNCSPAWAPLRLAPGIVAGDRHIKDKVEAMMRQSVRMPFVGVDRGAA